MKDVVYETLDMYGNRDVAYLMQVVEGLDEMLSPVRCTWCRRIYDVSAVTVTARYADCSVWKAPCCGREVDDRPAGWKYRSDIEPVNRRNPWGKH